MLKYQRNNIVKYNECYPGVIDSYFVTFNESLSQDVLIDGDMIYVKGKELYLSILHKTIKALDYLINTLGNEYDFIIRTNISTIINFKNLVCYLNTIPKHNVYNGGFLNCLTWFDERGGINVNTRHTYGLHGLYFVSGTSIIFSGDVVKHLLNNQDKLVHNIVDDVSLAHYVKNSLPDIYNKITAAPSARFVFIDKYPINEVASVVGSGYVFLRNCSPSRKRDLIRMNHIVSDCIDYGE